MGKYITFNPFPPGTLFLTSDVSWGFTRRGVIGRTNTFTPRRSGCCSKTLWKWPHQLCCGGQCNASYYKTRREGRAWAGLSQSKYGRAKIFSLPEYHWPPFTQHSWFRNFFIEFLCSVKCHGHCLLLSASSFLGYSQLAVLSHFSRLHTTTKCWHQTV